MTSQRDKVLDYISRFPGRDDDEIAADLEITPRQTVNQICRKLAEEEMVRRARGERGKLVNFAISERIPVASATPPLLPTGPNASSMTEDQVKAALVAMLEPQVGRFRLRGVEPVVSMLLLFEALTDG